MEEKLDEIISLLRTLIHLREIRNDCNEDHTYQYFAASCELLGVSDDEVYEDYLAERAKNGDELPPVSLRTLRRAIRSARPDYELKNSTWNGEPVRVWRRK